VDLPDPEIEVLMTVRVRPMPVADTAIHTGNVRKLSAAMVFWGIPENELTGVGIGCCFLS
jgi:hypothetical protein